MPTPFDFSGPELGDGITWDLLARYVSGDAEADEMARVARWRVSDPRHALLLTHFEAAWLPEPAPDGETPDVEAMSQAVMTAIAIPPYERQHHVADQTSDRQPKFVTPSERHRAVVPWLAGAVACLLVAGGAMLTRAHRHTTAAQSTTGRHYATTRGERATIRLPDGSSVILGYASTLTVPQDFGGTTRQVQVSGQAAFTVAPDRSTPFVVSVGNARTEVLGTSFIVQKYSSDATARVLVTEGRVSLRPLDDRLVRNNANRVAILSARMLGEVSDSGRVTAVPATADDDLADWTLDRIAFRATPLRDVIPALERVYDVDIRITDSTLLDLHVTLAAMPDKTPVTETLDLVTDVINAHFTRSGRVFTIAPGKRALALPRSRPSTFTPETQYGR